MSIGKELKEAPLILKICWAGLCMNIGIGVGVLAWVIVNVK